MSRTTSTSPADWTRPDAAEPVLMLAFCDRGHGSGQQCRIPRGGLLLGRGAQPFPSPFADPRMSERHAALRVEKGRVLVRDLGSAHGTRLNGQRLAGERVLAPGDVLRLGDTLLVYMTSSPLSAVAEAELVGGGSAISSVRRSIDAVATRKLTVVITGETGTGKEVVARIIHERSGRTGPFIAVNCGAFAEGLLNSELFGHVRGAFTGAVSDNLGLFRAAAGGTLLLDELAEMPLALQASLLRVLEAREVRPVGGTRHVPTDVRVIATSNRELSELVRAGLLRADLLSRLAQWTIRLPRLRERREDIPALVTALLERCDGAGRALAPDLAEALLLHDWPLNVRGLMTVLSVAVVSAGEGEPLDLTPDVRDTLQATRSLAPSLVKEAARVPDRNELVQLLQRFRGKVAAVCRHLGMSRPRAYRLLQSQGLDPAAFRPTRGVRGLEGAGTPACALVGLPAADRASP